MGAGRAHKPFDSCFVEDQSSATIRAIMVALVSGYIVSFVTIHSLFSGLIIKIANLKRHWWEQWGYGYWLPFLCSNRVIFNIKHQTVWIPKLFPILSTNFELIGIFLAWRIKNVLSCRSLNVPGAKKNNQKTHPCNYLQKLDPEPLLALQARNKQTKKKDTDKIIENQHTWNDDILLYIWNPKIQETCSRIVQTLFTCQ